MVLYTKHNAKDTANSPQQPRFTIADFPDVGSTTPISSNNHREAANFAFSTIFPHLNIKNTTDDDFMYGKFIVFTLKDSQNNKFLKYIGTRIKLETKVINNEKNKVYEYKNVIGPYRKALNKIKFSTLNL